MGLHRVDAGHRIALDAVREFERGGQRRPQHAGRLADERPQRDRARFAALAAAERQHLLDQVARAVARLIGLVEIGLQLRIRGAGGALGREGDVPHHAGQDVVEVVRDAARQVADRLHLLGLLQLRLELATPGIRLRAGRDVAAHVEHVRRAAVLDRHAAQFEVVPGAVPPQQRGLEHDLLARERARVQRPDGFGVGRRIGEHAVGSDHRVARVAAHRLVRRVDVDDAEVGVAQHERVRRGVEDRAVLFLAVEQRLLGALALGDVARSIASTSGSPCRLERDRVHSRSANRGAVRGGCLELGGQRLASQRTPYQLEARSRVLGREVRGVLIRSR